MLLYFLPELVNLRRDRDRSNGHLGGLGLGVLVEAAVQAAELLALGFDDGLVVANARGELAPLGLVRVGLFFNAGDGA